MKTSSHSTTSSKCCIKTGGFSILASVVQNRCQWKYNMLKSSSMRRCRQNNTKRCWWESTLTSPNSSTSSQGRQESYHPSTLYVYIHQIFFYNSEFRCLVRRYMEAQCMVVPIQLFCFLKPPTYPASETLTWSKLRLAIRREIKPFNYILLGLKKSQIRVCRLTLPAPRRSTLLAHRKSSIWRTILHSKLYLKNRDLKRRLDVSWSMEAWSLFAKTFTMD